MVSKKFLVSVVIPSYNGMSPLEKNLPKIINAKNNLRNSILEIIVVDDGSVDETAKLIKDGFPEVKLVKHKINRGFSSAVNTGVRSSKGDLILLLNNDISPEKDFLSSALKHFGDPKVFAVSLHEKDCGYANGNFTDGYIQIGMDEENKKPHRSFYVNGGSGIFKRKIWIELGGMDERLLSPFYWEDIDICYRAAKRGYQNLWEPEGNVVHNHESTISKFPKSYVQRVKERNQLLVIWKDIGSPNLIRKHILGLLRRSLRHPGYMLVVFMALVRLGPVLKSRQKESRECKVSDEVIFSMFAKDG